LLAGLLAFGWFVAERARHGGSFAFLFNATGWDISLTFLPYSINDPYYWAFLVGLTNTIAAGTLGIVGVTLIGFVIGAASLTRNVVLGGIARAYTDVIRNVPLLLQAIFWYGVILHLPPPRRAIHLWDFLFLSSRGLFVSKFADTSLLCGSIALLVAAVLCARALWRALMHERAAPTRATWLRLAVLALAIGAFAWILPDLPAALAIDRPALRGLNFHGGIYLTPEFAAVVIAIVVYRSAFMGEIFRGGFTSVSRGHIEAARALGLRPLQILWTVRLPLALVQIVPPMSS
jgi:general L-amino acid transport system permease protein